MISLGNDYYLLTYKGTNDRGYIRVAQISGSVISFGDGAIFADGDNAWENDWETNFISPSLIESGTALIAYSHALTDGDIFSKYKIATIDGMNVTLSDEHTWAIGKYFGTLMTISPSSILGTHRDSTFSASKPNTAVLAIRDEIINATAISGGAYPSTSGLDHIASVMWAKNVSGVLSETNIDFGYSLKIRPSAIYLGSETEVDIVGSLQYGYEEGKDADNEGHDGKEADYIRDNVTTYLNGNPADIVLLHIGTNDISLYQNVSGIRNEIESTCYNIFNWGTTNSVDIRIVLARITNWANTSGTEGLATTELNGLLQTLGDNLATSGYKISVVDMENALTYPDDIGDGVHPTASGHAKMASTWYPNVISGILDIQQITGQSVVRIMPLGNSITRGYNVNSSRGYSYDLQNLLASGISGVCWDGSGTQNALNTLYDGNEHFFAMDFAHTASGNWNLKTSLDGSDWVDQGIQTSNTQDILSVSGGIIPKLSMFQGNNQQWIDELAVWGGSFESFADYELSNLYDLAEMYSLSLDQYSTFPSGGTNLFIMGPQPINTSNNLFTKGPEPYSASGDLIIFGPQPAIGSGDLFIGGVIQASGDDEILAKSVDWLLKSSDHNPQLIGTLDGATSVNIQLWEITNGQNISLSLASSGCYQIGNTGRWAWSTANLPTSGTYQLQYFYMMTANNNEIFTGQFFLQRPEYAKWIYPRHQSEYLKQ
jgi:lysophospholipase L1-like esterase